MSENPAVISEEEEESEREMNSKDEKREKERVRKALYRAEKAQKSGAANRPKVTRGEGKHNLDRSKEDKNEMNRLRVEKCRRKAKQTAIPKALLDKCKGYPEAIEILKKAPCFTLEFQPSEEEDEKWKPYLPPRIFPIEQCVVGGEPPSTDWLLKNCDQNQLDVQRTLVAGFQPGAEGNSGVFAANIPLTTKPAWSMEMPPDMKHLQIADETVREPISMNICTAKASFDIHIDETSNLAGLGSGDNLSKFWICAPLNRANLKIFHGLHEEEDDESMVPLGIMRLENLRCYVQTPADAMWLSTGVLHATSADRNGALYGSVFEIVDDIHVFARVLCALLTDKLSNPDQTALIISRFKVVLKEATADDKYQEAVASAFCDRDFSQLLLRKRKDFKIIVSLMRSKLSKLEWVPPRVCPCKVVASDDEEAATHFWCMHLDPARK